MWSQEFQSQAERYDSNSQLNSAGSEPILEENDFLKMINLQERYNYFKTLIKLQRMHNFKEEQNQQNLMKVMLQLIEYYAQCISQVQINVGNIVAYFQHKMRELNYHYKAIIQKQKDQISNTQSSPQPKIFQLGQIPLYPLQSQEQRLNSIKSEHKNSLMIAIKNQNIQEHLTHSIKKVQFFKKRIASSIKDQEDALELRLKDKRKRRKFQGEKQDNLTSVETATTSRMKLEATSFKRKKDTFASFHQIIRSNFQSQSELDEAQSLYISNFNIEEAELS